jgi:hypothetical protein
MPTRTEAAIAILAALFVLFAAMLDPRISAALAVLFLLVLGMHGLVRGAWTAPAIQLRIALLSCVLAALFVVFLKLALKT